jgi:hypothetical protein
MIITKPQSKAYRDGWERIFNNGRIRTVIVAGKQVEIEVTNGYGLPDNGVSGNWVSLPEFVSVETRDVLRRALRAITRAIQIRRNRYKDREATQGVKACPDGNREMGAEGK